MPDASEDDRALIVEPLGTVSRGADIEVSYIACGLPNDEPFAARVTIRPADGGGVIGGVGRFLGGGDDPVRVTWDDQADGFATSRSRTITPGDLEAGSYRITLRVEDSGGRDSEGVGTAGSPYEIETSRFLLLCVRVWSWDDSAQDTPEELGLPHRR